MGGEGGGLLRMEVSKGGRGYENAFGMLRGGKEIRGGAGGHVWWPEI